MYSMPTYGLSKQCPHSLAGPRQNQPGPSSSQQPDCLLATRECLSGDEGLTSSLEMGPCALSPTMKAAAQHPPLPWVVCRLARVLVEELGSTSVGVCLGGDGTEDERSCLGVSCPL